MRHLGSSGRARWGFLLVVAAVTAWLVAMGIALYARLGSGTAVFEWQSAKQRAAEQRQAEVKAELAKRKEFQELVKRASEKQDVRSILAVADAYSRGAAGAPKDEALALSWYRRAALRNSVRAMVAVARAYDEGRGIEKNTQEAIVWYKRAARLNSTRAAERLGDLYFDGTDVERDDKAAFGWYQRAADAGNNHARRRMAEMQEHGRGVPQDLATAFYGYARLAEAGDPEMQNRVGWMLSLGRGVPVDLTEAAKWFKRAADQEYLPGVANLGLALLLGRGVERDEKEGGQLLRRAADEGESYAVLQMARLHRVGAPGFDRDDKRAVELLEQAAKLGNAEAKAELAVMRLTGSGLDKDEAGAHAELEELAPTVPRAKEALAEMYVRGISGVRADWRRARSLAGEAAGDGMAYAKTLYAVMLRNGMGGPPDSAAGLEALRAAADCNDPTALLFLADLVSAGDVRISLQPDPAQAKRLLDRFSAEPKTAGSGTARQLVRDLLSTAVPASVPTQAAAGSAQTGPDVVADVPPVPVRRSAPRYPLDLRYYGITGVVMVDFIVSDQGTVVNAFAATSSLAGFEAPAVAAVSKWTFKPGTKDGQPVNVHMQVPIVFALTDEDAAPGK